MCGWVVYKYMTILNINLMPRVGKSYGSIDFLDVPHVFYYIGWCTTSL